MRTKEEIIAFLEEELEGAYQGHKEWEEKDSSEAMKYRVKANTLEHILEEIDPPTEKQTVNEESYVAKVLVKNPEEEKPQKRGLTIFVNIYSFVIFIVSGVALNILFTRAIELFVDFKGLPYALFNLVFLCFHIFAFMTLLQNGHLTIINKKNV